MRYSEEFDNNIDIYSSYQDISSSSHSKKSRHSHKKRKKKSKFLTVLIILICVFTAAAIALYGYAYSILSEADHEPIELEKEELNITTSVYDGVKNIALLGIDSRKDNDSGRSDAVIILTIDKKHDKIKLTSIARDSYVDIDGHRKDKLTHAYAFGKSPLSVKTLNQNFGVEITDYVTVNFYEFARIIDYIGGVEIDISAREKEHLNNEIIPSFVQTGFKCDNISGTGLQLLDGNQALCYARIRQIDSDIERGNRQKEVLSAMLNKVRDTTVTKLPSLAKMVLSECQTSLSVNDMIDLGVWAIASKPQLENLSIPNDTVKGKGQMIKGVWYYTYDTKQATEEIKKFILETQ